MSRKNKIVRSLDVTPANVVLASAPDESSDDPSPPLPSTALDPPTNLTLTSALARSASTPTALINATWDAPIVLSSVDKYTIQWSVTNTFPIATTLQADTPFEGMRLDSLKVSTTYYVRVSAWAHGIQGQWSDIVSVATPADTVAPAAPTAYTGIFLNNGDLKVTWTEPLTTVSPNLRDIEIKIWDSAAKAVLWWTDYSTTGEYIFPFNLNYQVTSGVPDKTLYIELRSRSWWNQFSSAVVVGTITKAVPSNPTGLTAVWDAARGSFLLDWVDVPDANFYEVSLDGRLFIAYSSSYTYGADRNAQDHSGTPDPSITYLVKSVDAFGQRSTGVGSTNTLARPSTPTGLTTSWASDTGVAGPDCTITWNSQANIAGFIVTVDGISHDTGLATRLSYAIDRNRAEHAGTPDPVLTITLVARDGLGQTSSVAASATATNAAPPTTAIVIAGGFSVLALTITPSLAADRDTYVIRLIKDTVTVATYYSTSPDVIYQALASGSYQVGIEVRDLFGQLSTETVSSAAVLDAITIDELRADSTYSDSVGTDFTTAPNKTVLKDDTTGAGITYAASASAWRYTQVVRPLTERFRRISTKLGSGAANFYVAVSNDGVTWTWYAGVAVDGFTLTSRASEAIAQTNAALFTDAVNGWVELPTTVEGRYVRLYHRNTTLSYRLDEFYAYSIVIADMIRAGDIKALHIGAGQVTADKISVINLSAISANMGTITAGTITGATIRSAASGARWEGNSTHLFGTDGTTTQWEVLNSDGKFTAGAGKIVLDATGVSIPVSTSIDDTRAYKLTSGANVSGGLYGYLTGGIHEISVRAIALTGYDSQAELIATASSLQNSKVYLQAISGGAVNTVVIDAQLDTTLISSSLIVQQLIYGHAAGADKIAFTLNVDNWLRINNSSQYTSGVYIPSFLRVDGGLASGAITNPGGGDVGFSGDLRPYRNATFYTGYAFVPNVRLTSTSWDGDARSTTAKTLIDTSAVFGAPAGIKAALVYLALQDSGAGATDCYVILGSTNGALVGDAMSALPANDRYNRGNLVVPCDANGDFYFQIAASGALTMDVVLEIHGYWI